MLKYKAKRFLENCRILKEGEEIEKGKGMAILFDNAEAKFRIIEYNNSTTCTYHRVWGNIYLKDIFDDSDPNKTILVFQKKVREIVGKRHYKLHENAIKILDCKDSAN